MSEVTDAESGVTVETDIPPVDAAMLQDRFDLYSAMKPEPVPDESPKMVEAPEKVRKTEPATGIPSLSEWQDFIGRIVLRTLTDAFLSFALRDIEDDLTERERDMIRLTKEDLVEMSAPLASMAHKSKFGRKRGRQLIAASDSSEAVIALVIWMRRVNKISRRHRKTRPTTIRTMPIQTTENYSEPDRANDGQGTYTGPTGFGVFNPGTG